MASRNVTPLRVRWLKIPKLISPPKKNLKKSSCIARGIAKVLIKHEFRGRPVRSCTAFVLVIGLIQAAAGGPTGCNCWHIYMINTIDSPTWPPIPESTYGIFNGPKRRRPAPANESHWLKITFRISDAHVGGWSMDQTRAIHTVHRDRYRSSFSKVPHSSLCNR